MKISLIFLIASAVSYQSALSGIIEDDAASLNVEIERQAKAGVSSGRLDELVEKLALPKDWYGDVAINIYNVRPRSTCSICKATARSIINLRREGVETEKIQETVIDLCIRMNLHSANVCRGTVMLNTPVFFWIIDNDETVTEDDYCALSLQNTRCARAPEKFEWTVAIDDSTPLVSSIEPSGDHFKIIHISDIHYDPLYEPGGNAECGEPNCCRRGQGPPGANAAPAGYWGDYRVCDAPWHAVADALEHMQAHHGDADFVYYTGDIVDHGEWETTRETNTESIEKVYGKMKQVFGETPVYPIIGNHEANPLNIFASPNVDNEEVSTKWLYELLADIWISTGWLPESTRDTILRGGFYTVSPKKGFRIIALNNNVAYTYNWWLIYEPNDLGGQLKWLMETLLQAEKNHELVHILAHVPSGNADQQNTWSREYRRIINRFSHIISGQFNGHVHNDEFNVFYHPDDYSRIINVAWNGGSVTTWAYLNPNYKVYTVNANTYEVEDAENWIYNMTEANSMPEKSPRWFVSYTFKDEYGLSDLSKESLHSLIREMTKGGPKAEAYNKHSTKMYDPTIAKGCDNTCAKKHVCKIVTAVNNDDRECNHFKGLR